MLSKMILKLGFLAFCLFTVDVTLADSVINEREKNNQKYEVSQAVTKMMSRIPMNDSLGFKQFSYLEKHPSLFDVVFAVGLKKIIVKAPRLILTFASPVFEREFEGRWGNNVAVEEEEILLPNLNPDAFKLFVELTILDSWSVEALKALELSPNALLHLMSICHKYEMTNALTNLMELANDFLSDFGKSVKPEDFLFLSQSQLEAILGNEELSMSETDVYTYASRWAEEQCQKQGLQVNGENIRLVLGGALYQIRFGLMSIAEFVPVIQMKGLLSVEEVSEILRVIAVEKYISSDDPETMKFKFEERKAIKVSSSVPPGSSIVSIAQVFPVVDTSFVCDGSLKDTWFRTKINITILGVGFLGPLHEDSFYNVTVQIKKKFGGTDFSDVTQKEMQKIFANKSETFYFIFNEPVVLNTDSYRDSGFTRFYSIFFSLKGPDTRSLYFESIRDKRIKNGSTEFEIMWHHHQLVEIVYKSL